jgi:crotonobetainyl-CoA:carnitine CoA-transferase CaiB-like acyl-CoA transferase
MERVPPVFNQDTEEILSNLLGYGDEEIKELKKAQVL